MADPRCYGCGRFGLLFHEESAAFGREDLFCIACFSYRRWAQGGVDPFDRQRTIATLETVR